MRPWVELASSAASAGPAGEYSGPFPSRWDWAIDAPVKVLLMRHGEAVDPSTAPDPQRWLTARGRATSVQVAEALGERGLAPTHLFTSPLVRAVQTAELVAQTSGHPGPVRVEAHLVPGGTTAHAVAPLDALPGDAVVWLVTHEPTVRVLAAHLSGLASFPGFRTSGVAVIRRDAQGKGALEGRFDPSGMLWRDAADLHF